MVIDTEKQQILEKLTFHHYVTPTHTEITDFCTELTGITKEMVSNKLKIGEVLNSFKKWFSDNEFVEEECCLVTCGNWDMKALKRECDYKKINYPKVFKRFINIKELVGLITNTPTRKWSMPSML